MSILLRAFCAAAVLAFAFSALPAASANNYDAPNKSAAAANIGAAVDDFKLPDADGKQRTLSSLRGKNGTVLIFVSTQCPVSNAYNARMEQLAQEYAARGVNFVGVNSNVAETPEMMKAHAAENKMTFTVLKDAGNKIADRLGARVTPEVFFLDASGKLAYRGRIDNLDPRRGAEPTSTDLRNAIDATLAGKSIERAEALAFGCSIKRG